MGWRAVLCKDLLLEGTRPCEVHWQRITGCFKCIPTVFFGGRQWQHLHVHKQVCGSAHYSLLPLQLKFTKYPILPARRFSLSELQIRAEGQAAEAAGVGPTALPTTAGAGLWQKSGVKLPCRCGWLSLDAAPRSAATEHRLASTARGTCLGFVVFGSHMEKKKLQHVELK